MYIVGQSLTPGSKSWVLGKVVAYGDEWLGNESVSKREDGIAALQTGNEAVPTIEPDWDYNTAEGRWDQSHFVRCILEGLRQVCAKTFSSVEFSHSVLSDSLQPHGLQPARPPCGSPTPGVYSNSCPLSWWCHPKISSSLVPFSSRLQSFPASGSFLTSQFFTLGGQSIGVSASASVLLMNIQDWFPLRL